MALPGSDAAVLIELDTTPPVVEWQAPASSPAGTEVVIPISLDEPASVTAELYDLSGNRRIVNVMNGEVRIPLHKYFDDGAADLVVTATDTVGNVTVVRRQIMIVNDRFPLAVWVDPSSAEVEIDESEVKVWVEGLDA